MSQPTVSEAIRRIENAYGTRLFVRGSRRLMLTAAGEGLLPLAEQTLTSAQAADQALKAIQGLQGGIASFGLLRNAKYYGMADLLGSFHQAYPRVRLRIVGVNSADVADLVRNGELEAGLVVLPVDSEELVVQPLIRDEVLYVSADPEHVRRPVSIAEMAGRELVFYDAHAGGQDPTRRQLAERALLAGVSLEARIEVEQVDTALELVAAGSGDTIVSRAVLEAGVCPPNLHVTSFEHPLYDVIALIRRKDGVLSPATNELARFAKEMMADHPGAVRTRPSQPAQSNQAPQTPQEER